jgi:DegV family protein with EDD domain
MANKVAIVTDSTVHLPQEFVDKYGVKIAHAVVIWGDEELVDDIDITPNEFYERLSTAKEMPTTSQPSPAACKKIFDEFLAEGYDILCMPISNLLSGTIDSMNQAMAMLPDANIELVDSLSTSMQTGWQIMQVGEAALKGASLAECKALAEKLRGYTDLVLTVDTLEFLHRGGRIGGASRWVGTMLQMKPVLEVRGGRIEPLERIRTRSKSLDRLVEIAVERIGDKKPVYLACLHANIEDEAKDLLARAADIVKPVKTIVTGLSPAVGTHTGPGTIGLAWMAGYKA